MLSFSVRTRLGPMMILVLFSSLLAACMPALSFYEDPAPLPGEPGAVIRSQGVSFNGETGRPATAVIYQSTDVNGQANAVSGTVIVPTTPWSGPGPRPLIAIAPGSQGVGDQCAPSKLLSVGFSYEAGVYDQYLQRGYALAITDYSGLGTPGTHPFVVAAPAAQATLDMARAALKLPGTGLAADAPVVLVGYSQGGQAVAKAAEIESSYASELNIVGAAVGGAPADLARLAQFLNTPGRQNSYFLALTAIGLDAAYPELNLADYLNDFGRIWQQHAFDTCVGGPSLNNDEGLIEEFTVVNPLSTNEWQQRLAEQRLGFEAPRVPIFLYHGSFDEVVPPDVGQQLRSDWCSRGAPITWQPYSQDDHLTTLFSALGDVTGFVDSVIAGQRPTGNCL